MKKFIFALLIAFATPAQATEAVVAEIDTVLEKFYSSMANCNDFKCMEEFYKNNSTAATWKEIQATPDSDKDKIVQIGKAMMGEFLKNRVAYDKKVEFTGVDKATVTYTRKDCTPQPCSESQSTTLVKENGVWKLGN